MLKVLKRLKRLKVLKRLKRLKECKATLLVDKNFMNNEKMLRKKGKCCNMLINVEKC